MNKYSYFDHRPEMKEGLDRYVEHGIPPGGFLRAVLENDLFLALGKADLENQRNLVQIAKYICNELPKGCWGSKEIVRNWIKQHKKEIK